MTLLALWPAFGHAQTAPADQRLIERQQDQIQQLQQQRFEQRDRDRWQSEAPPTPLPEAPEAAPTPSQPPVCFTLKSVSFEGATLLSGDDRQVLTAPYVGRCVAIDDINALIRAVTDLYASRGYVTTRVVLPQQNVAGGALILRVLEGRIQGYQWNGEPADGRTEVATAFPAGPGEPLNLRDLEQGLDQINRLRMNDAKMQLVPGDQPGDTRVVIEDKPSKPWRVTAGADNSGQQATGELQAKASASIEDVFGLNDSLEVDHNQDRLENSSQRGSGSWAITGSVPYGYWRLNATANSMFYRSLIYGQNQVYQSGGSQRAAGLALDRLLYRDDVGKTYASLSMTYKSVTNSVANVVVDGSSPKLAIGGLSLDDVRRLLGGILHSSAQASGGSHMWGARDDLMWPGSPKAQFIKYQGDLSYGHPIAVAGLDLTWSTTAHGQWTGDSLYSTEQIAIGSETTVRGYKDQILEGNRGGTLRNELSVALPTGIGSVDDALGVAHPFVGYDIGMVTHFHPETAIPGRLTGTALGVRLSGPWVEGELTYSWALAHPAVIETPPHQLTFSLVLVL